MTAAVGLGTFRIPFMLIGTIAVLLKMMVVEHVNVDSESAKVEQF